MRGENVRQDKAETKRDIKMGEMESENPNQERNELEGMQVEVVPDKEDQPMDTESGEDKTEDNPKLRKLRFQLYKPRTEMLQKYCEDVPESDSVLQEIENVQKEHITAANRRFDDPALDFDNMIPKSGDWDIRRHLQPKLQELESKTHRAILDILSKARQQSKSNPDIITDEESISSDE